MYRVRLVHSMSNTNYDQYLINSIGVSPRRWGSQNPPATSDVVFGEIASVTIVTSDPGQRSRTRTADDTPMTPAPITHTLTGITGIGTEEEHSGLMSSSSIEHMIVSFISETETYMYVRWLGGVAQLKTVFL